MFSSSLQCRTRQAKHLAGHETVRGNIQSKSPPCHGYFYGRDAATGFCWSPLRFSEPVISLPLTFHHYSAHFSPLSCLTSNFVIVTTGKLIYRVFPMFHYSLTLLFCEISRFHNGDDEGFFVLKMTPLSLEYLRPKHGDSRLLRNVGTYWPGYTAPRLETRFQFVIICAYCIYL
jgi:hypothetical protein